MRIRISVLFILVSLCFSCDEDKTDLPNIVFIITDDISFNDIGCYGNSFVRTPNIDLLAAEGMVFDNAYLTASSCSPTRCSIITGRYPHNTGAPELHTRLPENQVMFPQLLREAGYYTVLSGKNHMGDHVQAAFDTISHGAGPGREQDWIDLLRERPADKPFFCWFASADAHRQWEQDSTAWIYHPDSIDIPPMLFDGPLTRQDLASYYHEVSRTDYYLGRIREELEIQRISGNTYIIYCSDNGRPFPRCKVRLYDSGIKTPFIVSGPGIKQARTGSLVSVIDIAPTLLELAGVPEHTRMQGTSFTPILEDPGAVTRDFTFSERNWHVYQGHERMVRHGDWMYIRNWFPDRRAMCVESDPYFPAGQELWEAREKGLSKPEQEDIFLIPRPPEELYQVVDDPYQFHNLAGYENHREILDYLRGIMDVWVRETGDGVSSDISPDNPNWRVKDSGWHYGSMPGSQFGADTITSPGPIRMHEI